MAKDKRELTQKLKAKNAPKPTGTVLRDARHQGPAKPK